MEICGLSFWFEVLPDDSRDHLTEYFFFTEPLHWGIHVHYM